MTVTLTQGLVNRLRSVGAEHDVSISALTEIALRAYLDETPPDRLERDLGGGSAAKRRSSV
jgi:hypothetical protein